MPKADKSAPPGSKRRVTVRRKGAAPEVDPAIAYAIAQAIEAQEFEKVREIALAHEAQLHTLRVILFDLLIIFREEHYKAGDVVSKKRFAEHIAKVRATLEQNVPEFKAHHKNANDIDDLDANTQEQDEFGMTFTDPEGGLVDIAELVRQAAEDAEAREGEDEIGDMMDEMLERASEEAGEEWTSEPRPHPRSRRPRR